MIPRTDLVLRYRMNKLFDNDRNGKIIVATSLMKEIIHLKSDINIKIA